jgi:hypothetical protein
MRHLVIAITACIAVAGCKKADKQAPPATAVGSGSGSGNAAAAGSAAPAEVDPWAGAPDTASTLGANTGDDLAELDVGAPTPAAAAMKVNLTSIPNAKPGGAAIAAFAGVSQTGFRVVYTATTNQIHDGLRQVLSDNRVFETLTEALNKLVRLPSTVDVQLVDCGTINAFYDPNQKRVIVCYELMTYFAQIFKPSMPDQNQLGMAVIGATTFAFFHEIGHGLIHILQLPAVGREEDSADQLATMILIADGEAGIGLALSGAHWFQLQEQAGVNKTPFSDEHAFDMQRFYNILCMVYGSDPTKYADFVTSGTLPPARAQRCPEEYGKIRHAWEKLLQPHMTNAAAENVDYKPSVDPSETGGAGTEPTEPGQPDEPAAPSSAAITCEQVATKAIELVGAEAVKQAAGMTADEVEALRARLEAELPAFAEQLLAQCAKDDWPDKDRQCVLDADTLDAASACGIQ